MPDDTGQGRIVLENAVMRVRLADVEDASGRQVKDFLIIESRRNGGRTPSGIVVVAMVDGKVGMLRVYRPPVSKTGWELPRGFIDEGEDSAAAASRELMEETGLSCPPDALTSLGQIAPEPGVIRALHPVYLAVCNGQSVSWQQHDFGHATFSFFSQEEIVGLIKAGEIFDSNTISALHLHHLHNVV